MVFFLALALPLGVGFLPFQTGPFAVASDIDHNAHLGQQQDQTGAAGGEEGQRNAGVGQGVGDNGDVAEHLPGDLRHDADAHQRAEPVFGMEGDPEALHQKEDEQHDDDHRADEAQFLAHDTEDKVVGALRQPELLFDAVAKAQPRGTARADGVQALLGLAGHPVKILRPAVQTALQVVDGVHVLQQSLQQEQRGTGTAPGNDAAAAAQQQDGAHDGRGQQDARHVGLQHQQDQDRHQPQDGPDELHHDAVVDPLAQGAPRRI